MWNDPDWWTMPRAIGVIAFCLGALFAIGWIVAGWLGGVVLSGIGLLYVVGHLIWGRYRDRS